MTFFIILAALGAFSSLAGCCLSKSMADIDRKIRLLQRISTGPATRPAVRPPKYDRYKHLVGDGDGTTCYHYGPGSYDAMLLCGRADQENAAVLAGEPLAMYGQFLPDPMFLPPKPTEPRLEIVTPPPWWWRLAS